MATLDEIAKRAGVSKMTVSNVLNGRNKESWPSTVARAEKIRAIADELGYRPNAAAKAVATGRFGTVGIFTPVGLGGAPQGGLWFGVQDEVMRRDLHLTISSVPDAQLLSDEYVPRLLSEWMCDGLLVNYIHNPPPKLAELIARHRVPAVWMNVLLSSDCVHPDDFDGGVRATEHLLSLGHRDILYADLEHGPHYSVSERRRGYRFAMARAGLAARVEKFSTDDLPETARRAQELLRRSEFSAVLCYELVLAAPFYASALRLGVRVPEELSLLTFHENVDTSLGVPFSTVEIPLTQVGREAVRRLAEKIADPELSHAPCALALTLQEGATCAPPQKL